MKRTFFPTNKIQKLDNKIKIPNFGRYFNDMGRFHNIKTSWIIHIFAILHAVVALGCRAAGFEDELLLTILTMTMALLICLKKGLSVEFTAASIIVVNILGYMLGNFGADMFQRFLDSPFAVHALATFFTTEILGWSLIGLTKVFSSYNKGQKQKLTDSPYLSSLILAMCGIFVLRLAIIFVFSTEAFLNGNVLDTATKVFSNSFSLIILICINVLYVRYARRFSNITKIIYKILILIAFTLGASLLETFIAGLGFPASQSEGFTREFPILFATSLLAQITVYCIVFMINYALSTRSDMQKEREKANMAQYRYIKLKHQVNPHFLFNSLNILDCLICEECTERASSYTHKLAGVYRYMLKSEDEMVVSLRDELVFVNLYVDLLKERFPVGFSVETDVSEGMMARFVLPCSIQLLIENAIKHNTVSEDNPLVISIKTDGEYIKVTNNISPKVTQSPSTGLGQQYIRQMYLDLTGKQIGIEKTESTYQVTLPLI